LHADLLLRNGVFLKHELERNRVFLKWAVREQGVPRVIWCPYVSIIELRGLEAPCEESLAVSKILNLAISIKGSTF